MGSQSQFFTTRELADHLNMSIKFIINNRQKNRIPGAIKCGRYWRYRKSDIFRALNSGTFLLD